MSGLIRGTGSSTRTALLAVCVVALLALLGASQANAEGCSRGFTNGVTEPSVIEGIFGASSWSTGAGHSILEGEGFTFASGVTVGDQPATSFTVLSDTELEFVAPPEDGYAVEHGDKVEALVTTPGGSGYSCPAGSNIVKYTAPVAPAIFSVSPSSGPEAGGNTVTIEGGAFTQNEVSPSAVTAVHFGSKAASFEFVSAGKLRAVVPAGKGLQNVTVTTSAGTSGGYSYLYEETPPAPEVVEVEPGTGPAAGGNTVHIWAHYTPPLTAVSFGSKAATSFKQSNEGFIEAVAPAGSGTVDVRITAAAGTSAINSGDHYTYEPAPPPTGPVITSITPNSGSEKGGTKVTIEGTNLGTTSFVHFGPNLATGLSVISDSKITAVAPSGGGTVDIVVETESGESETSAADHFAYLPPPSQPHFGRCATVPAGPGKTYKGGYKDKKCSQAEPGSGRYEWTPALSSTHFTLSGGTFNFTYASETGTHTITCTSATGSGQFQGTTGLTGIQLSFDGCSRSSQSCQTGATGGEVAVQPLKGEIGWENKAKRKVALGVGPASGETFVQLSCGTEAVKITRGVLGKVKAGKMGSSLAISYKASGKGQQPSRFEGAEENETLVEGFALCKLNGTLKLTAEEPFEINPAV
jgi:hypothetical protein